MSNTFRIIFSITAIIFMTTAVSAATAPPARVDCPTSGIPAGLPPAGSTCYSGQDGNGSFYLIGIPPNWNGSLFLYMHGGPNLTAPAPLTSGRDFGPTVLMMKAGYATAASSYRDGGYHIDAYAEDTENLRQIFAASFGQPKRTFAVGVSFGALIADRLLESYAIRRDGTRNYDGGVQICGPLSGLRRLYYQRIDARVVYQHYCGNLPAADETPYEPGLGLPDDSKLTLADVDARVDQCTGVRLPAAQRSESQRRNLANILAVMRFPEVDLLLLMQRATFGLRELRQELRGNAFPNCGVHYDGSEDDAALNVSVDRYVADPAAVFRVVRQGEPSGKLSVPVITLHSINDGLAVIEHESAFREAVAYAGSESNLKQVFVDGGGHTVDCGLNGRERATAFLSIAKWAESGVKPGDADLLATCDEARPLLPTAECRFKLSYVPGAYASRVRSRVAFGRGDHAGSCSSAPTPRERPR